MGRLLRLVTVKVLGSAQFDLVVLDLVLGVNMKLILDLAAVHGFRATKPD